MADHTQEEMRNATVAFLRVLAITVAVGEMSAEEFLETVDQGLDVRLQQPDGEDLAVLVRRLRGLFGKLVSKGKISLEMGRAVDAIFDGDDDEQERGK